MSEPSSAHGRLRITQHDGDLFDAPSNSILIHACNTRGAWGAGIALQFKRRYPNAFRTYREYCRSEAPSPGTTLLIPPMDDPNQNHWIGCLFTSKNYGRAKDSPDEILENTSAAMFELLHKIKDEQSHAPVGTLRMCEINSGHFGVPWERTLASLSEMEVPEGCPDRIEVWRL